MEFGYNLKHILQQNSIWSYHMKNQMKENEISNSPLKKNGDIIVLIIKFANQILFLGKKFLLPFHC